MKYKSTRGGVSGIGFSDAVLMGLAEDGGLLLPEQIPDLTGEISSMIGLSYRELAFRIMELYCDLPGQDLERIVDKSYSVFRHGETAPVVDVGDVHVLELFHGPTLAFKDIALQYLGNLFEYILNEQGRDLNIVAATSGDTGSAAICGVRGRERMSIFVMHPEGRISRTQELQMTTVLEKNVFNIAVKGTFDDCQALMKEVFNDLEFKSQYSLGTVNSINWARVLAQIVYYFYSAFRVMERTGSGSVRFSVPTGNFGDILAGYFAAAMGLPVEKLILATNENDILARFFETGVYRKGDVKATISPSMDIQVASNFERYLYYRCGSDPQRVKSMMDSFAKTGEISVELNSDGRVDDLFAAHSSSTESTLAVIKRYYLDYGYLLDPHTATGVDAAGNCAGGAPVICLATAHPAKFSTAIKDAVGEDVARHEIIDGLENLESRCSSIDPSADTLKSFIENSLKEIRKASL